MSIATSSLSPPSTPNLILQFLTAVCPQPGAGGDYKHRFHFM